MNKGTNQQSRLGLPVHYGWIIALITFLVLLIAGGIRSLPTVFIVPFEHYFGWNRAIITFPLAVNLLLYGLYGPVVAVLMELYGVRRIMLLALLLLSGGIGLSGWMQTPWQMTFLWGIIVGTGTGFLSTVVGSIVAVRWFVTHRGLVVGIFSAAGAAGQLIFLSLFSKLLAILSWQTVVWSISLLALTVAVFVALIMRNTPRDVGLLPYGASLEPALKPLPPVAAVALVLKVLKRALPVREFWLLAGSFFVCGATSNGLIGTHFIPACVDHGLLAMTAAGLLSVAGVFNVMGAAASGWLSDKFDNRWLLFWYYCLRGLSLLFLPFGLEQNNMSLLFFIVFYGLDWAATVPPTVRLTADVFGGQQGPVIFGWLMAIHQVGAALAAWGGGILHTWIGNYLATFAAGGALCLIAAGMVGVIRKEKQTMAE
ncbi:MFS transporter [Sporomusa termitida]|uniref:Oxalate/formate antiporter family transporter n=1 Tax=Sporomusa termitida TaxID=2377 RepID=A0A517DW49_9FIRM|nr:MFS transporter [Sporomusa termitida]QDR81582.1 oxalate/formate antiporter family transporter [Sporomusa termitida]